MISILVFPLYFEQMEMLLLKGDYMGMIVIDHMVILCQHYMGTYFTFSNQLGYVGRCISRTNIQSDNVS